ncbi:MAG: putative metal-binding motif-containing protein [bacterium]
MKRGWSLSSARSTALALCVALMVSGGCETAETGILVEVTLAESDVAALDENLDELVFHIGVSRQGESGPFILDPEANETPADVVGRSLSADPYRLLIRENGDGVMETVKVAVLGYRGGVLAAWGWMENPESQTFLAGHVAERTVELVDAAQTPPTFVVTETGCLVELGGTILLHAFDDRDCDGWTAADDCNDEDPNIGPGAPEVCGNGIDDNCNGVIDEIVDEDGDGYTNCEPIDCDDTNAEVYPGAVELCDGLDNNCDGACDEEFDLDGDGYTACPDGTGALAGVDGFCGEVPTPALWDCDDNSDTTNPGQVEVCNGRDDNCDGQVDEGMTVACYEGPAGTEGVGQCRGGFSHCVRGVQGPCTGQILPSPEACNNLDDDCDSQVDEDQPTLTCGQGTCVTTVDYCQSGVIQQQCVAPTGSQEICNGLDDDCDGLVDETCACVHVSGTNGNDTTATGGELDPFLTINAAIAHALQPGNPKVVCVASLPSCSGWAYYDESVVMKDGVSVYGGYNPDPTGWTRNPTACRTEIRGQNGVGLYFGPGVVNPTILDGFVISLLGTSGMTATSVVDIEGSTGAVISGCEIYGPHSGDETYGITILDDPNTSTMATPQILRTKVEGGDGISLSVGIYSENSAPFIGESCDGNTRDGVGRCSGGCWNGTHIRGHRTNTHRPVVSYGVLLSSSPGAVVDQSAVCAQAMNEAAGIKITGDAAGTQVTRNDITVWGAMGSDDGILMESCGGASPWIGNNYRLSSEGDGTGQGLAVGVRSEGDCHPLIEANRLITGGLEGSSNDCRGVVCGSDGGVPSRCAIVGNTEIRGSSFGLPPSSYGVLCEDGACGQIRDNLLIHGRGGVDVVGLLLRGTTTAVVDSNVIVGGCGSPWVAGVVADDSNARLQNNAIHGGLCSDAAVNGADYVGLWIGVAAGANELDAHSNAISGGGGPSMACVSTGVAVDLSRTSSPPTGPLGILRNNVIDAGACGTAYGFWERDAAADPRILESNDIVMINGLYALYLNEDSVPLSNASSVNAMSDITVSGNIDAGPGWSWTPGTFPVLPAGSPCRDAGTTTGMPSWDYEGDARPQGAGPDIGPDES